MVAFDASEALTPYRAERGYGAILFDRERLRQAGAEIFSPAAWGERARPVTSGRTGPQLIPVLRDTGLTMLVWALTVGLALGLAA